MTIGPLPDAMEPDIQGVRTHWIRGFMAFHLAERTRAVMLMVPVCPECGFLDVLPGRGSLASSTALRSGRMNAVSTPYDLVRTVLESRKSRSASAPTPGQGTGQGSHWRDRAG
jgi:hypothetical protein